MFTVEISLLDHKNWLYAHRGEIFDKNGKFKQQYLFKLSEEQKIYLCRLLPKKILESLLISNSKSITKIPNLEKLNQNLIKPTSDNINHSGVHNRQNDQIKDDVGKLGEQAVYEYLTKKYTGSNYEIIPVSSNLVGEKGDDAAGYDILLKDDNLITYIDVKTTTGSNQSFYMSVSERRLLDSLINTKNKTYSVYRVYGVSKTGNGIAKFEIFEENDLRNATYQALNFFVSI